MKCKWSLRLGAAVLCAVLLGSCSSTAAAPAESTAPADPLTGQQLLYPEQRAAAVVIENTTDSTTQWGIGSASVVLEAMTESGSSTELCLVYPALSAMPVVGPVTRGQDLYWRLLSGQQVLPIQRGSSAYAKRYLEYYNLRAWMRRRWDAMPLSAPVTAGTTPLCGAPAARRSLQCWTV